MTRTTVDFGLADLAASVAASAPRVLILTAPPGYGKHAFLRDYAAHAGRLVLCELDAAGSLDPSRPVLDALVATDAARATRSAADRLAQRRGRRRPRARPCGASGRSSTGPELFALHDPALVLATPAGADLLAELIRTLPPQRSLPISTRTALPPALRHPSSASAPGPSRAPSWR